MPEPMTPEEIARHTAVLKESQDVEELYASAIAMAESEDRHAIVALARLLRQPGFFARLEGSGEPVTDSVSNLADVFAALTRHANEFTGRLCELIYGEEAFREVPSRINLLLFALGAVHPMTPRAVEIFRETSASEFAQVNGPILLANGEPPALEVFAEIVRGDWVEAYVKVDILHRALLPVRDRLPIVQMCIRLLSGKLEESVRIGIVETLFDHRSKDWFGPAMYPPEPPDWNQAPDASLELLVRLAERLLGESLPPGPLASVRNTLAEIAAILRSRRQ
jgi:hypothetical protein